MSMSKEIATYADVKAIFDKMLETKQDLKYKLPSMKAAHRWRYRAYYYRKLLRKQDAIRLGMKDIQVATPYDGIQIIDFDINGTLLLKFAAIEGKLMTADEQPVPVSIDLEKAKKDTKDPDQQLIDSLKEEIVTDTGEGTEVV